MNITIILTGLAWFIILVHSIYNIVKTNKLNKKETIAVLQRKDEKDITTNIDPNTNKFNHKDESYITPQNNKQSIKLSNKTYVFYTKGQPEPKNIYTFAESRIPADVFKSIMESEALKMLNKPSGALSNLDLQEYAMIAGAALLALIIFL